VKMPTTVCWEICSGGSAGWVMTQMPSCAIFVKTRPWGSTPGIGLREESPMSKRPRGGATLIPDVRTGTPPTFGVEIFG